MTDAIVGCCLVKLEDEDTSEIRHTRTLLDQLTAASGDRLIDARNRALPAVAYGALLRRSALVSLQVSDLVPENNGSATLLMRRSKTDPEGEGTVLYPAPDTVSLVLERLDRSGVQDGHFFRAVCRSGRSDRGRTLARCRGSASPWPGRPASGKTS